MTFDEVRAYCLSKPGAVEEFPFGEFPVFKVGGKIFALLTRDEPVRISLKCDPAMAIILRDTYSAVTTAPYMDKRHWNQVLVDGTVAHDELVEMIDASYRLVVKGLPKALRERLNSG